MQIYRKEDRITTIERGGPGGVTILIAEAPDGTSPHWTLTYYPATRNGRERPAFTEDSDTSAIPDEFADVLTWAKHRWDEYLHAQRAA